MYSSYNFKHENYYQILARICELKGHMMTQSLKKKNCSVLF